MKKASIQLETLSCPSCMAKVEAAIKSVAGVSKKTVSVSFNTSKAKLEFDENQTTVDAIEAAISKVGYEVIKSKIS